MSHLYGGYHIVGWHSHALLMAVILAAGGRRQPWVPPPLPSPPPSLPPPHNLSVGRSRLTIARPGHLECLGMMIIVINRHQSVNTANKELTTNIRF